MINSTSHSNSKDEKLSYQRDHIPIKHWRRFVRGQVPIEARCDLHGYNRVDAQAMLHDYLDDCVAEGDSCVLLIHGKGEVLKDMVSEELQYHPMVLAYASAIPKHGGTGAIYIMLKKAKTDDLLD